MDREAAFSKGDRLLLIHLAKAEEALAPLNIRMGLIMQRSSHHCRNVEPKMGNNLERKRQKQSPDNERERDKARESDKATVKCEMLINQGVKSASAESGCKMKADMVISFQQCWPERVTTASKN